MCKTPYQTLDHIRSKMGTDDWALKWVYRFEIMILQAVTVIYLYFLFYQIHDPLRD